jgi:formylglycine-generating enzyme
MWKMAQSGYMLINDLNPNFEYNALPADPPVMKRKVVRGGSYKDVAYFTQVSTRSFEYQDTTKSYIGFRCVRSTFGNEF